MEMVFGLFGGGAAAGGAAATGAAVGGTSGALTIFQGLSTAAGVLSSLSAGAAAQRQANMQAQLEGIRGRQEAVASEEKANNIKRQMLKTIGQNRVAFAASGVDVGSGTSADMEGAVEQEAEYATRIEKDNAELRLLQSNLRASLYRDQGRAAKAGAGFGALQAIANFGIDIARRG